MIVECPTCGQKGSVPDRDDRRTVRCKRCQESFCVPASGSFEDATNSEPSEAIHPLVYASLAIAFGVVAILGVILWRGDGLTSTSKPGDAEQVASAAAPKPGPILPSREGAAPERPVEITKADGGSPGVNATPVADKSLPDKIAEWERCVVTVETNNGVGSGFAVTPGNLIVTNFHVIAEASRGSIRHSKDEIPIPVEVVAVSPEFDLAVLKILGTRGRGIGHYLELADQTPQKGSQVYAIGSPLNLEGTVSSGIVSGIRDGTDLQELLQTNAVDMYKDFFGFEIDMEWIQTSAAINHGNSGGPLIDAATSKVIGVNTMTHHESQNVGFAVSADHVRDVLRRCDGSSIAWGDLPISRASQVMAEMAQEEAARTADEKEREQRIAMIEQEQEEPARERSSIDG